MKRLMALFIAGFFAYPSMAGAQVPAQNVVRATLANGLHVVLLPDSLAPVATTVIVYNVGAIDDSMPGIAHATEHMMFRGTADVSAGQLSIMAARAGAEYDASTGPTVTDYYFKLPSAYVGVALRIEADRMTGALDSPADWKTERGAIEQEVRAHESVPGASVFAKMRQALFGETPYAEDGVGTVASFERMQASDIAAFYRAWYHPNNATLIVSGDIDPQQTLAQIHQYFDPIPQAALPQHRSYAIAALDDTTLHDTIAELPVPVSATSYRMPALGAKDYMAVQVLMLALDNVRGGFGQLQAKGQILGAAVVAGGFPDVGTLIVAAYGEPGSSPQAVQDAAQGVLDDYRTNGVPQDLIDAAKLRLLSERDYRLASISGLAFSWSNTLVGGYATPDEYYAAVQGVSAADVDRVLREYADPKHSISMLLEPKNFTAVPHADPNATAENVHYDPDKEEPLPPWASEYFNASLQAPQQETKAATFRLSNGLKVTVRRESLSPTVVLSGSVRMSPELYEPNGKEGVAAITSELLSWGTATYDRAAFQAQQDAIAADISLGPSFSLTARKDNFDRALQLLADGMLHPAFNDTAFEVVKNDSARTTAVVQRQPGEQAQLARLMALYPPGDPRRRHETAQTLGNVTRSDVKQWYAFAYRPELTTIAVVGDVTPDRVRAEVQRYFGAWRQHTQKLAFVYPKIQSARGKSVIVTSESAKQSEVTLTQVLNVHLDDRDYIPLQLADTVLSGEGTGSMLFRDLREKSGFVYDVSSNMDIGSTSSTFSIDFASDPKNVARAQAAALADIKRLQTALIPLDDLQRAKALLLAQRILPLDSYEGIAADILDSARYGISPADDRAFWDNLLRTTPDQVRAAMRRWVRPDGFTRVMVQPAT